MAASSRKTVFLRTLAASVAAAALLSAQTPAIAKVGVAAAVNTDAKGRPPGGAPRVISLGQTVIFNEQITTDARGLVQVLLLDGTTFTVGPNSELTIDEFVYNPATGDAKVVASVAKGAFRFIGGQTSRRPDGATINTPVGTIGIRGAMVEGRVESSDKALFSMIFGNEVNFNGRDGKRSRIYEPGYTLVVQGGGGGGLDTNVRRRTESDASTFQTALSGGDGQNGGTDDPPTDNTVRQSPLPQSNSNLPNTVPIPTPRSIAVKSTDIKDVETGVGDADTRGTVIPPQTTSGMAYYVPDPNAASGFSMMSFNSPAPFTQELVTLNKTNGRLVAGNNLINLPDYTGSQGDSGLQTFSVGDGVFNGNTLTGYAYAGKGDFAAYLLEYGTETAYPFYMIHGTGTDLVAASDQTLDDIRQYTLTSDPSSGGVPFFAPTNYGPVTNYNSTNFYVVEPGNSTTGEFETFMSWISIEGDGLEQKSAVFVTASANAQDEGGTDILAGARRGSYRTSSYTGAVNMRGSMTTLAGPDGSHFFGDNADHFVIGSSLDPTDPFFDSAVDGYENDEAFGSHHVAALVEETPQAEVARTTRTVTGFMAGVAESDFDPNYPYALASDVGPNFFMQLNAENHSVAAVGVVGDVYDNDYQVDKYLLSFGAAPTGVDGLPIGEFSPLLTTGEGATGGNTFVNDDIYGAAQNNSPLNTRILTDGDPYYEIDGEEVAHTDTTNAGSYLVSGRAVPIEGYSHCGDCDFIDWGWWGTRVVVLPGESESLPDGRRDYVHMGTWVAGDITADVDLPTNVRATYEGTMLGTVVSYQGEAGAAQYIASGTFGMTYNFNDREGDFWITDFAGISLSGNAYGIGESQQALFYATNGESQPYFYVNGAFVNNGDNIAGGVIGDFTIYDPSFYAVGTIAGKQTERVEFLTARVLTAPDIFVPIGSEDEYDDAGPRGLVGGTETSDRIVTFDKIGGMLLSESEVSILPDVTGTQGDNGLEAIAIEGYAYETEVSGTAYAGAGDFAAYLLGFHGDPTDPYYLITGTPTSAEVVASLNTGTNIREYTLTQDPIEGIDAPFFFDDLFGAMDSQHLNSSNLFIVESDTAANNSPGEPNWDAKVFQSWIYIEGEGENQKSAAFVLATPIGIDEAGEATLGGARRGSFRFDAGEGPANMRGSVVATEGPSGNTFFGANADHFILGASITPPDGFADTTLNNAGYTGNQQDGYLADGFPFATHHVASLVGTTPQDQLGRTTRTYQGFMAGLFESSAGGADEPYIGMSGVTPTLTMSLDASNNSVAASAVLYDTIQVPGEYWPSTNPVVDYYELAFGGTSGGAFVDDDRFGAIHNGDNETTRLVTEDEQNLPNKAGDNPGSYIVSGRANPIEGYAHCSDCSFLDWGWWGTRVRTEYDTGEGVVTRTDYAHMGTWVAGDITHPDDLPTNVVASYSGTAIGNVTRQNEGGTATYIASGAMDMTFDFNNRQGTVNINNFDGLTLSSGVSDASTSDQALFAGYLTGSGMNGGLSGAFVNNGDIKAGGVIGNFGFQGISGGDNVMATGTIAGRATSGIGN
ncbi:MAG: FecR domain-containing protein [Mesorhizobium sp.]